MGSTALLASEDQNGDTMITGSWATAQRAHAFVKTATSLGSFVDWLHYKFDSHERPSRGKKNLGKVGNLSLSPSNRFWTATLMGRFSRSIYSYLLKQWFRYTLFYHVQAWLNVDLV